MKSMLIALALVVGSVGFANEPKTGAAAGHPVKAKKMAKKQAGQEAPKVDGEHATGTEGAAPEAAPTEGHK